MANLSVDPGISGDEVSVEQYGNPIRLAWGILLVAFAVFCLICAASTLWTNYFFFQSSVRLDAVLEVGSGTIGVREGSSAEQTETGARNLGGVTMIRTDQTNTLSQATISFRDPSHADRLVAAVTLRSNTTVSLRRALRPRFDFTSGTYRVVFEELQGEVDVTVTSELPRDIELIFRTPLDVEMRILEPGRYVIASSLLDASLTNRQGVAIMIASEPVSPRSIPEGQRGVFVEGSSEIVIGPNFTNLLKNSSLQTFTPDKTEVVNDEFPDIAIGWQCSANFENVNRTPLGNFQVGFSPDGRRSFRLLREGASNNVATGCLQTLGSTEGIDIRDYNELWLQAVIYVDLQSLSACGIAGSECPLMMRILFEDDAGQEREWIHGVYAQIDPSLPWPLRCDTCRQDHYRIYQDAWYVYNSGNLFTVFPPDERPARVLEVSFYASGHNYDVYVNEIALLARTNAELDAVGSTDGG